MLAQRVEELLKQLPPGSVYQHRLAELPQVHQVQVEIPPIPGDLRRQAALALTFHYVQWQHGEEATIAYVPALGIEVLAEGQKQLAEQLVPQIRSALSRRKSAESLRDLVWLGQSRDLRVKPLPLKVKLPTLKQAAQKARHQDAQEKSVLKECATNLAKQSLTPIYEREVPLRRLAELLTARSREACCWWDPPACGKTALVRELARRRGSLGLGQDAAVVDQRLAAGRRHERLWHVAGAVREARPRSQPAPRRSCTWATSWS